MQIILNKQFKAALQSIVEFIELDSLERAMKFRRELMDKIKDITFMPYRFRKNQILGRENVRDLVFKGYVVVFEIKLEQIEILNIYKSNLFKF